MDYTLQSMDCALQSWLYEYLNSVQMSCITEHGLHTTEHGLHTTEHGLHTTEHGLCIAE